MAGQAVISILIKARDEASRVLKGVGTSADALGLALAGIGAAGVGMATAMTLTAARTEELGLIAHKMGEVHGYTTAQIDATENSIKKLGITTQTARLLIAQLIGSQTGLTKATNIARAAQDLATLGAVDSSEATADLAYAIASLQPRLLRKYRIYISLVRVYRDAANALDKNVLELTEAEKRHAFLNAVLQEAAQYTGLYEEKMKTASGQLRSMQRYIQEAANTLGQVYVPVMKDAVAVTNKFLETVGKAEGIVPQLTGLLIGMAGSFAALTGAGILLAPRLIKIAAGITALSTAAGIAGTTLLGTVVAIAATVTAIGGAIVAWRKYKDVVATGAEAIREAGLKAGKSYDEMARAMRQAYMAMPLWKQMILDMTGGMYSWIDKIIGTQKEWEKLGRVFRMSKVTIEDLFPAFYGLAEAAASSADAIMAGMGQAFLSLTTFFAGARRDQQQYDADRLTLQRRIQYFETQLQEEGYDEQVANQLEAHQKQLHALEQQGQRMEQEMKRQMGVLLITQVQALDLGVEATIRASLAIAEAYGMITAPDVQRALTFAAPLVEREAGLISTDVMVRQLTALAEGVPSRQYGGIVPGPIGQPQLIMAHGGETVTPVDGGGITITIGALYGTDRLAATRFGRQLAKEIRAQGVRTR